MKNLGWNYSKVDSIRNMLQRIKCTTIRTVDYKYFDIEIYNSSNLSYSYLHLKHSIDYHNIKTISNNSKYWRKCHRDGSMTSTPSVTVDSFLKRFRIFKDVPGTCHWHHDLQFLQLTVLQFSDHRNLDGNIILNEKSSMWIGDFLFLLKIINKKIVNMKK